MTKYSFFAACGVVTLASTMNLSAQTPAPPTTRPQPPAPTQTGPRPEQKSVTVVGCLKPWDNTMGAAPTAPMAKPGDPMAKPGTTPMAGTRYVLTADAGKPMETSTTSPATPAANPNSPAHPQASQYVVIAAAGVNLAAHANHQVSVTGTVAVAPAIADSAHMPAARPGDAKPPTAMHGDKGWETLTATSVTMVSASCTAKS